LLDRVAGFFRNAGGGDDETLEALAGEVAVKDVATGAGLIGENETGRFRVEPADELVDVALAGADGIDERDVRVAILAGVGDGDGVLVDVEADEKGGRLAHG
jgi:hypothetical protein